MRIGIEAQRIFRTKKHGMDIYALQLIRHLQEIDKENEYVIFTRKGDDVCLVESSNLKIVIVPGLTYLDWEQIQLPIYAAMYKVDILHSTSNTAPLLTSIRQVVTIHDIIYLNQGFGGGSYYQRLGHYYRKALIPLLAKKDLKIITVSNYEKKVIDTHFDMSPEKVDVTYNGISSKFRPIKNRRLRSWHRKKLELPDNYIFFLGNKVPKKNMKGMIQAYEKYLSYTIDPLPLVIAEVEPNDIMPYLKNSATLKFLKFTGYIKQDLLPVYYTLAKIFVYPSLRESFGIPLLEAMACGTRVISSNTSSMPEVAGDAAFLVNPTNVTQLASAIAYISELDEEEDLTQRGLKRAHKFNWRNTARRTTTIYCTVFELSSKNQNAPQDDFTAKSWQT